VLVTQATARKHRATRLDVRMTIDYWASLRSCSVGHAVSGGIAFRGSCWRCFMRSMPCCTRAEPEKRLLYATWRATNAEPIQRGGEGFTMGSLVMPGLADRFGDGLFWETLGIVGKASRQLVIKLLATLGGKGSAQPAPTSAKPVRPR